MIFNLIARHRFGRFARSLQGMTPAEFWDWFQTPDAQAALASFVAGDHTEFAGPADLLGANRPGTNVIWLEA